MTWPPSIGTGMWVHVLDVTDTAQMRRVVAEARAFLQRVDVVVSNAGLVVFSSAEVMIATT
jgi:NADP-dependent 3-hydroxy acid dehydrogenase YdfG